MPTATTKATDERTIAKRQGELILEYRIIRGITPKMLAHKMGFKNPNPIYSIQKGNYATNVDGRLNPRTWAEFIRILNIPRNRVKEIDS